MIDQIKRFIKYVLSIRNLINRSRTLLNNNDWLSRSEPISRVFGLDRGKPIDRYYIENFLYKNKHCINGSVVEIGDDRYTIKFGQNITNSYTIAGKGKKSFSIENGDLTNLSTFQEIGKFHCVIATNVINFIYDYKSAVKGLASLVNDDGYCLCTVAGLSQISEYDYNRWGDYWRFTDLSLKKIFEDYFEEIEIINCGNAMVASAFIMGLSVEEIPLKTLMLDDKNYSIVLCIKASKPKLGQ
jgi:hypothetical protein